MRAAYTGRLSPLRELLHRPAIAVRILEEHEPAPRELLHLAGVDTPRDQLGVCGVDVVDDHLRSALPGSASLTPSPSAIEQAEPGGVSWTKRISSLTTWSWSAMKPAFST
jgi:hypothetical protein